MLGKEAGFSKGNAGKHLCPLQPVNSLREKLKYTEYQSIFEGDGIEHKIKD